MASKNKIIRYAAIDAQSLFDQEHPLIEQVKSNQLDQVLLLWQAREPTLVLPAGKKWPVSDTLIESLNDTGWQLTARKTGGAPVPQLPGIINLSHIYHWPQDKPYDIKAAFLQLCDVLIEFFKGLGVEVAVHATPNSYCDGDYNLNIGEQKIVGTAQRVLLQKGGGQVVLSQACIIIDANAEEIVKPVILCNQICGNTAQIDAYAHTSLYQHIEQRPSVDNLFQAVSNAFLQHSPH